MQPVGVAVGDRGQTVLDALAHHRPLLARDRLHVALVVGLDRFTERHVEVRPLDPSRPPSACGARCRNSSALRPGPHQQALGMADQRRLAFRIGRQRAAIDAERHGDQRVAEQQRLHPPQRQHAGDRAVPFGETVMRAMAECGLDHLRPAGAMEERAGRHRLHESVPGRFAGSIQGANDNRPCRSGRRRLRRATGA